MAVILRASRTVEEAMDVRATSIEQNADVRYFGRLLARPTRASERIQLSINAIATALRNSARKPERPEPPASDRVSAPVSALPG